MNVIKLMEEIRDIDQALTKLKKTIFSIEFCFLKNIKHPLLPLKEKKLIKLYKDFLYKFAKDIRDDFELYILKIELNKESGKVLTEIEDFLYENIMYPYKKPIFILEDTLKKLKADPKKDSIRWNKKYKNTLSNLASLYELSDRIYDALEIHEELLHI